MLLYKTFLLRSYPVFIDFYSELFGGPRVLIGMCCHCYGFYYQKVSCGDSKEGRRQWSFLVDFE